MKGKSELMHQKKVDYFGLWNEAALKKKIAFDKKEKEKELITQRKKKVVTKVYTDALQARREEIFLLIEELKNLDKKQERISTMLLSEQAKQRQEELIYIKKILEQETRTSCFILMKQETF